MEVFYIGKMCDDDVYKFREKKQQPYFVAQYMYEKALFDELERSVKLNITPVSIYQTEYYPKDKLLIKMKGKKFHYLSFINLPLIREISYFISCFIEILKWYVRNKQKKKCIYSSTHFPPVSLATVIAGRLLGLKIIVTFTDLADFSYSDNRILKMKKYKRLIMKPYKLLVNKLQEKYDGYVLFSEKMNLVVNKTNKPHVVVEGIFNNQNLNIVDKKKKKKVIAHAGTLNKEVGIDKILNVFDQINDKTIELWFIGKGDMVDDILEKSIKNPKIKYLGYLSRDKVFEKLKEASLLINLRNPENQYTKNSFPSKMFEYMVSGTPVLTTKLEGIPKEYFEYVYTINTYENRDIAKKIDDIFLSDPIHRWDLGIKAKHFIIENKNAKNQTKKIINFIERVINTSD